MKKYYNYYDGKKERKPTDRERKEEYFGGYEDLKRLSLGITETDDDSGDGIDDKEQDAKKDETFTRRWRDFATGKDTKSKVDNILDLNNDEFEVMRDRLNSILDSNPEFLDNLSYLVEPILRKEREVDEGRGTEKQMRICNKLGYYGFDYFLRQLDLINKANKGDLINSDKK